MRAVLLYNPNATAASDRVRDVIASAIASELKLDVYATKQRGHATHITAGALHEGVEFVFAFGGDGTANEAIQAIAGTHVRLGVIPGGSTNVLARDLGLPNDPVEATGVLLERIRQDAHSTISLGNVNGRYFATSAGFGLDAAIVRLVERRFRLKRAVRQLSFVWCGLQEFFLNYDRTHLPLLLEVEGEAPRGDYGLAIVGNTTPYTYLGSRPLQVTPDASFRRGLDLLAVKTLKARTIIRILLQILSTAGHVRSSRVDYRRDLDAFTLTSDVELPLQVDGDYAGEWKQAAFSTYPEALTVIG